jgi:single-strand DNA-binding protein
MLNNCLLTGNLGADVEVFFSSEGEPVATFNLAFRSSKKKTGWIKVTCFRKLAEIAERHLHKGARIAVIGTLDQHKWEKEHLSASSILEYVICSLSYKFGRIDKLPMEFKSDALEFGTCIHRVLEEYYSVKMMGDRMLLKDVHEYFVFTWLEIARGRNDIR